MLDILLLAGPLTSLSFARKITAPIAVNVLLRTCPTRLCPRPTTLIASFPWPCRLVVEDGLAYQPASWHLWRDHRVFVPFATLQNWVEGGGEKGRQPHGGLVSQLGSGGLSRLHRGRRVV